jgi:hypothetical protein
MADDDDDLLLGEADQSEDVVFPPPERKITTTAYDLSVNTLVEQWDDDLLIIPPIQREYVWDNGKASRLIESLLLNIPIPVLYFQETEDAKYEIIDGHQRVKSVVRYIKNEFGLSGLRILDEYKRKRFHQLPEREQRFLRSRVMRAIIITQDSHPTMKIEVFGRLNTGGIALNSQELRNALFQGTLNDLLGELQSNSSFRTCIGTKQPRKRMVDQELVLRYLALRERIDTYRPPLIQFLHKFMRDNRNATSRTISSLRESFESTVELVGKALGGLAFRPITADGEPLEAPVNRALFDAQMLAFSWANPNGTLPKKRIIRATAKLYEDEDFLDAIRRATGDRARLLTRLHRYGEALEEAGLEVNIPV